MAKAAKTKRTAAKRFKITGSGRILHQRVGGQHYMLKKSKRRKRDLKRIVELHPSRERAVKALLPNQ
ncbi:MAG: 50S ribosomal protein L35 [Armatimonadetes bacterium]|nr:50S ribosomal protein L35 [Armatimonadota bacterium]MDW8027757.1 50S ribosomal protein L35 [Armatimonadota bacterium]